MLIAICLNSLIALFVIWLACGLWQWRCRLALLAQQLERSEGSLGLASQQVRYDLAHQRVQIVQTHLTWVRHLSMLQRRSRQLRQLRQLIRLLQLLMLSRNIR
ncbi:MAG: hypothetical protein AAF703_19520 [Cyanobacteria bacterium P01_D01_bin.105]